MFTQTPRPNPAWIALLLPLCTLLVAHAGGCNSAPSETHGQKTFSTPQSAVESLAAAARKGDTAELSEIFGPEGKEILSSGDPVADRNNRQVFLVAFDEQWKLEEPTEKSRELIIGDEQWPFPVPLVKEKSGWRFDTAAGKHEVLARRIGRNELAAIGVCRMYVIAQRQYAAASHDGLPAGSYAQKIRSEPGRHDGLYWASTDAADGISPLSDFAAQAVSEGYSAAGTAQPRPYQGYYFRILTQQGIDAPGGRKNYIVDGALKDGFALIAYPAAYGNSGIMTFIINQNGVLHEADLGPETLSIAEAIKAFDPDIRFQKTR